MTERDSQISKAFQLGEHHGKNGAAPRTGIAVTTAQQFTDHDQLMQYNAGLRAGWKSKGKPTPTR